MRYLENEVHDGLIFVQLPTSYQSVAYLASYNLIKGAKSGIVAQLYDSSLYGKFNGTLPTPLNKIDKGILLVELPDGKDVDVAMSDDGEWPDLTAGDGIFGAAFNIETEGDYVVTTELTGLDENGNAFVRTTDHFFQVITANVTLTGTASAVVDSVNGFLNFTLPVSIQGTPQTIRAYAEVYGAQGSVQVPVAWVGGVAPITQDTQNNNVVVLSLNLSWLSLASASAPFFLQNVYITDLGSSVPMTQANQIQVDTSSMGNLDEVMQTVEKPTQITNK